MSDEAKYEIKITTDGNDAGAKKVESAVKQTGEASVTAATAATTAATAGVQKLESAVVSLHDKAKAFGADAATVAKATLADSLAKLEKSPEDKKWYEENLASLRKELGFDDLKTRVANLGQDPKGGKAGGLFEGMFAKVDAGFSKFVNALGVASAGLAALKAGWEIGTHIRKNWFEGFSSAGLGKATTENDMAAAEAMRAENNVAIRGYSEWMRNLKGPEDLDAFRMSMATWRQSLDEELGNKAWNENAQKDELGSTIKLLDTLIAGSGKFDRKKLQAVADEAAADERRTANRKTLTEGQDALRGNVRRDAARNALDQARELAGNGDFAGAEASLAKTQGFYKTWLERIDKILQNDSMDPAAFKRAFDLKKEVGGYLFASNAASEDVRRKKEDATTEDQKKREVLAAKQEELSLNTKLAQAVADGNTAEERRLNWLKDYNDAIAATTGKDTPDGDQVAAKDFADARFAESEAKERLKNADKESPEKIAREAVGVSNMARLGQAVGESQQAFELVPQIARMIEEARKTSANTGKSAATLEKILKTPKPSRFN